MIEYGIALFTYNRPKHTQLVLESLIENSISEIYIFQDGLKKEKDKENWIKTREIIDRLDGIEKIHRIYGDYNKGLSAAIEDGVTYVLNRKEAVIVLEDDCYARKDFISFMEKCFELYKDDEIVQSISGYSWPIELPADYPYDIYFTGRISSWGWGTWKNRWKNYNKDYDIIRKIKASGKSWEYLQDFGGDLEQMLLEHIKGNVNSWAVFWALHVIYMGGICIAPKENLIKNIGFDGSGVHCKDNQGMVIELKNEICEHINFPPLIEINNTIKSEMRLYFYRSSVEKRERYYRVALTRWINLIINKKSIADWILDNEYCTAAIWGLGEIAKLLILDIEERVQIKYFVVSNKNVDQFNGYPVLAAKEALEADVLIVIPGYEIDKIELISSKDKYRLVIGLAELLGLCERC